MPQALSSALVADHSWFYLFWGNSLFNLISSGGSVFIRLGSVRLVWLGFLIPGHSGWMD